MFANPPLDKPASSPFLKALLSDPSMFEEIPLEVPNKETFSTLGDLFGTDAIKDVTSFKVVAAVSAFFFPSLCIFFLFF